MSTTRTTENIVLLFYNPRHPTPRHFLDMNNTLEKAELDNTHPWIQATWTNNRFYVNSIPIPREDDSEDISNGGPTISDSSEEAKCPEYDTDSNRTPYA